MDQGSEFEGSSRIPVRKEIPDDKGFTSGRFIEGIVGNLQESLNRFFGREHIPNQPQLQFHIFYSPHGTPEDLQGLREPLSKSDIFIPENAAWSESTAEMLNAVSDGKRSPKDVIRQDARLKYIKIPPALIAILPMLHNSHKPVVFMDIDPAETMALMLVHSRSSLDIIILREGDRVDNFSQLINSTKEMLQKEASLQTDRESLMLVHLEDSVRAEIQKHSDLRTKDKVNVLLQLGSVHTSLFHRLRKSGQQATREFSSTPYVYSYFSEGLRRAMFNKEVDDQLTARILLEEAFIATFELTKISPEDDKLMSFTRKVVSQFSLDEIRNIFERLVVLTYDGFQELFAVQLKEKGVEIPQTEQELDKLLARRE